MKLTVLHLCVAYVEERNRNFIFLSSARKSQGLQYPIYYILILQSQNFIFSRLVQALIIEDTLIRLDETIFFTTGIQVQCSIGILTRSNRIKGWRYLTGILDKLVRQYMITYSIPETNDQCLGWVTETIPPIKKKNW